MVFKFVNLLRQGQGSRVTGILFRDGMQHGLGAWLPEANRSLLLSTGFLESFGQLMFTTALNRY